MPTTALFDLAVQSVGFDRGGAISPLANTRPPPRIDGLSIGVAVMERPAPHAGERHMDGDELLHVVAGHATLLLERPEGEERIELAAGAACIVPRGLWHRVIPRGEVRLLYATPGPNTERRLLG